MEKKQMVGFTDRIVRCEQNSLCWYEYCPSNEIEFKDMVRPLLHTQYLKSNQMVRKAINQCLDVAFTDMDRLSESSSFAQWEDAYWMLYLHGDILIGYMKSGRKGINIFAAAKPDQRYLI